MRWECRWVAGHCLMVSKWCSSCTNRFSCAALQVEVAHRGIVRLKGVAQPVTGEARLRLQRRNGP